MHVYLDADSFIREARTILLRRVNSLGVHLSLVGSALPTWIRLRQELVDSEPKAGRDGFGGWPRSCPHHIHFVAVEAANQAADTEILNRVRGGDLVCTRDILLAEQLLLRSPVDDQPVFVINDRGDVWDATMIAERRSIRDVMLQARQLGLVQRGDKQFTNADKSRFAAALDKVFCSV